MEIVTDLSALTAREPAILTIGMFDGVHLGHQQRVRRAAALAATEDALTVAVTYWPLPSRELHPNDPVPLLTTYDQKVALLEGLGVLDVLVVMPFVADEVRRPANAWLDLIAEHFAIRGVIAGPEFSLGGGPPAGDLAWLRAAGQRDGFSVEVVDIARDGARVTSTRIREALAAGEVASATEMLGRPYTLRGMVVQGDQRGRLLGFPTANLRLDPALLIPANGVYAVRVGLEGETEPLRPGVANVGVRPTFGADNARLVEVHLLDATIDLYNHPLETAFVARLREEMRFPTLDALKAQIAADATEARTLLGGFQSASQPDAQRRTVAH